MRSQLFFCFCLIFLSLGAAGFAGSNRIIEIPSGLNSNGWGAFPAISYNNQYTAGVWSDGAQVEVRIYSITSGSLVSSWPVSQSQLNGLARGKWSIVLHFSPVTETLIAGYPDGSIEVRTIHGANKVSRGLSVQGAVSTLAVSTATTFNQTVLLAVGAHETVIWNLDSYRQILSEPHLPNYKYLSSFAPLWTGAVKPNGTLAAVVRRDGVIRVFNLQTKKEVSRGGSLYFREPTGSLAIATGTKIPNRRGSGFSRITFEKDDIRTIDTDPLQDRSWRNPMTAPLLPTNIAQLVRTFDVQGNQIDVSPVPMVWPNGPLSLSFSQDGKSICTGPDGILTLQSQKKLRNPPDYCARVIASGADIVVSDDTARAAILSPDGSLVATFAPNGNLSIWDSRGAVSCSSSP